jgi:hypothetical protein
MDADFVRERDGSRNELTEDEARAEKRGHGSVPMVEKQRVELKAIRVAYEGLPPEIKSNGMRSSFALAGAVVRAFMGDQWFDRHVVPSQRKPGFVTMDESSQISLDLSAYRLIDLAELLYNLQLVEGFDDCLDRMRQGDIEATYAELDLGRMLFWHHVLFRYVKPTGVTGADYDVDIIYPNGLHVCGDAKCKVEGTDFNARSIGYSLSKARKQLPDDQPGIVFVKIPPRWYNEPNFINLASAAALEFLRTTRRVVSVKFYVSATVFHSGWVKIEHGFKELSNPVTDFGENVNWDIFHKHTNVPASGMPAHWQRILFYPDGVPRDGQGSGPPPR